MKIDAIVLFLLSRNSDVGISMEITSPSTLSSVMWQRKPLGMWKRGNRQSHAIFSSFQWIRYPPQVRTVCEYLLLSATVHCAGQLALHRTPSRYASLSQKRHWDGGMFVWLLQAKTNSLACSSFLSCQKDQMQKSAFNALGKPTNKQTRISVCLFSITCWEHFSLKIFFCFHFSFY